jgi:hypothetical protein
MDTCAAYLFEAIPLLVIVTKMSALSFRWNAQLWLAGQTRQEHVGGFATTEAAAAAHDLAALTIKGIADARTNFPLST